MAKLEYRAWLEAADALDLTLPDRVTEALANMRHAEAELERLRSGDRQPAPEARVLVAEGQVADAAVGAQHEHEQHEAAHAAELDAAEQARSLATNRVQSQVARHREVLVAEVARPAVTELVEEAATLAHKLARFAPRYDPSTVATKGGKAELDSWRRSRELDHALQAAIAAWHASWTAATSRSGSGGRGGAPTWPAEYKPGLAGGLHAWLHPHAVLDVDTRDGVETDVLHVGRWHPEATYRLASGGELTGELRRVAVYYPQVGRERRPRRVLLPAKESK